MIGLDTNVLVRYLTQDDPEQACDCPARVVLAPPASARGRLHDHGQQTVAELSLMPLHLRLLGEHQGVVHPIAATHLAIDGQFEQSQVTDLALKL